MYIWATAIKQVDSIHSLDMVHDASAADDILFDKSAHARQLLLYICWATRFLSTALPT